MKKLILSLAAAVISLSALADEGMWMLPYLQKMNIKDMKQKGLKLSAEEIYSINNNSLKDAIVIFGRGCTGEIVSPEGLLFTNHHCGYGNIQSLSSVENDYLKNGFWAMSNKEEIPAPGLEARFIRQIVDVTPDILAAIPDIAMGEERQTMVQEATKSVRTTLSEKYPDMEINIRPFFGGNQYFAFVQEVYKDIRLVGTPPTSIGKFGGETDNWMWPRHTGDFAIFRVYADKDNKPAAYSPENRPYRAKEHLAISLNGYEEGDFAMIMGFPGSTQRYMTSYEIDRMLSVANPQRIFIRGERQDILKEDMESSDKIRIQYASKYAGSSNYWKNSIGMSRGIERLNVKARKEAEEAEFQKWAARNTMPTEGYIGALPMIKSSIEDNAPYYSSYQYLAEALARAVEILIPARVVGSVDAIEDTDAMKARLARFYKDFNTSTDKKVAKRMLEIVMENSPEKPTVFADVIDKEFEGSTDAYVDYLFENSAFATEQKAYELLDNYSKEAVDADPAVVFVRSLDKKLRELVDAQKENNQKFADGHRLYIAGKMKMQPEKAWASDANFTIRLTYGTVLPYIPADGVLYKYYTTLKGVIEKEDATNPTEFTVPAKLKELYEAKDYGRYADKNGELPVAFLADCDITGGNSGSPIMNGKGELIGLAFDGNWEAMSGDVAFEPELQRTISVDVRYVLFVVDKFAGAGWLLNEMTIK